MTKPKSIAAQTRNLSKKAADLRDREGVANLGAAAVVTRTAAHFADYDFALGCVLLAAKVSSAKQAKYADVGRDFRLSLVSTTAAEVGADLVVRLPADHPDAAVVATTLLALGLKQNRKRAWLHYMECVGVSDEAAVRAVVEPVGGTVTVIISPNVMSGETSDSDRIAEVATGEAEATVGDKEAPRDGEAEKESPEETRAADDAAPPATDEANATITAASEATVREEVAPKEGEAGEGAVEEERETDGTTPLTTDEADVTVPVASEAGGGGDTADKADGLHAKVVPEADDAASASASENKDVPATASTGIGLLGVPGEPRFVLADATSRERRPSSPHAPAAEGEAARRPSSWS